MSPRRLPPWARELLDRYPGSTPPTTDQPLPVWLEDELAQVPLWARIRGTNDVRQRHPYLLIEDVRSQPDLMRQALDLRPALADLAHRLVDQGTRHLVFTGCGSAFHASQFAAFLFRQWTPWTTECYESLEFTSHWTPSHEPTALIAQSATGFTAATRDAAAHATHHGLLTAALTNSSDSAIEELCHECVAFPTGQRCGPAVSVLTTRLMMLYLLALEVGIATGRLHAREADELSLALAHLPEAAAEFLQEEDLNISQIANELKDQEALLFVGGGPNWFSAREGALKVEEQSCLLSKAYRPAEFLHCAIPVISETVGTVIIGAEGRSYARSHDAVRTSLAAGAPCLALVVEGDGTIAPAANFVIALPDPLDELVMPSLATIAFQLLGYYLGAQRGHNPDALRTDDLAHARAWLTAFPFGTH